MPQAHRVHPTAPGGLAMPDCLVRHLGHREHFILDHGFDEVQIGPAWWRHALANEGMGQFEVSIDPNSVGSERLTRRELFGLAKTLNTDALSEDVRLRDQEDVWESPYLNFLWHVLAWGSGDTRRNNLRRIRAFVSSDDRTRNVRLLRVAAHRARQMKSSSDAYSCLIRAGGGMINGLGPAFFTKFLYFIGAGDAEHPCLILDARVSESLFHAGWVSLPRTQYRDGTWNYSYNWHTETYVSYCNLLKGWAANATRDFGYPVAADEIERALFEGVAAAPRSP